MSMLTRRRAAPIAIALALGVLTLQPLAVMAQSESPSSEPSLAASAASPAPAASEAASPGASAPVEVPVLSAACAADQLATKKPGRLTLGTDNPAYPPWWGGKPPKGSKWKLSDPYSGQGYESAVAYAVAETLGFAPEEVDWIHVRWAQSFAPGPKDFDGYLAQVAIKPKRAQRVDFSDPYYSFNQSIIAMTGSPITQATTIEELKAFKLGAQIGTTSLDMINEVVVPTQEAKAYPDNDKALRALRNGNIDGLVADLPTAFYMRDEQLEDYDTPEPEATIVGQFPVIGEPERLGIVLAKDSQLTGCVDEALAIMIANGTLATIYDTWLGAIAASPVPFFALEAEPAS